MDQHTYVYPLFLLICCSCSILLAKQDGIGTFWQVTDFHYDANYSTSGSSTAKCHQVKGQKGHLGAYGNYLCDPPYKLVLSAVDFMVKTEKQPDFVLWTGDNIPHVDESDLSSRKVYQTVANISGLIARKFGHVPIFPAIGNHDIWKASQLPAKDKTYYENMLTLGEWDRRLTEEQATTFKQGGYYEADLHYLKILVLNTNLYYKMDKKTAGMQDPAAQLRWLEGELQKARREQKKVLITGHVPPGALAGDLRYHFKWFYSDFNERYLRLLRRFPDVTTAHVYAHEHTDGYHILYSNSTRGNRKPLTPMFLGPAVTPWKNVVTSNNPSVRLYMYEKSTGNVVDYKQYYMDLQQANKGSPKWRLEYQATKAYNLKDLSADSMHQLTIKLTKHKQLFNKYFKYSSVSFNASKTKCTNVCRQQMLCAISMLDYKEYNDCLKSKDLKEGLAAVLRYKAKVKPASRPVAPASRPVARLSKVHLQGVSSGTYHVMIGFMVIVIIMFLVLMIIFRQGVKKNTAKYTRFQDQNL